MNRDVIVGFGEMLLFAMFLLSSFVESKGTAHSGFEAFVNGGSVPENLCLGIPSLLSLAPVLKARSNPSSSTGLALCAVLELPPFSRSLLCSWAPCWRARQWYLLLVPVMLQFRAENTCMAAS